MVNGTTRLWRYGTMDKQKSTDWYGHQVVSDNVPLIDPGEGRAIILREFRFQMMPNAFIPTNQMLFNVHWPYIKERLWADGLEANEDHPPRVVVGKYAYRIFIVCEVKGGRVREGRMRDKAKNISEIIDKKKE